MPFSKITGGLIYQDPFNYQNVAYQQGTGNNFANQVGGWQAVYVTGSPYGFQGPYGPEGAYAWPLGIENAGPPQDPTSISTQSEDDGGGTGECYYQQLIDVGTGAERQVHIYVQANADAPSWARGLETPLLTLLPGGYGSGFVHAYAEIPDAGLVLVKVAHTYGDAFGDGVFSAQCWVSHLVICSSNFLTLTGFAAGQKIEIYQQGTPSPTLVASATVPANSTDIAIDLSNVFFPYQYFLKVYTAAGKIIETTPLYTLSGGDTWAWTAPISGLIATASNFMIYQIGGVNPGLPQNASINATLNDQNGVPYSGATIQFATDLGVLSAPSALTDLNGRASVILSSTKAGIAVVTVKWGGDPNNTSVPAATAFVVIHVWTGIEIPDASKPFQFFCEGQEYVLVDGTYTLAANEVVGNFEVDLPVWDPSVILMGLCSFYRFGVKEFSGILTRVERRLSDSPIVKLIGVDASWLLNTRVVSQAQYVGSPASVLAALLTSYGAGISPGEFTLPSTAIAVVFNTVQLLAAVNQVLATVTGGQWRVNADLTLDASDSFGTISDADFAEANAIASSSSLTEDLTLISNNMHVAGGGKPAIRSLAADPASMAAFGLLEGTDLQPSITDQSTLDLLAAYDAARNGLAGETVQLSVQDLYPSGTYRLYDYVTVTSPTLGLAGFYQVMQFTRTTLRNPYATQLQLGARVPELWQMDEPGKRIISQLGVVTPATASPLAVDNSVAVAGGNAQQFSGSLTHAANVVIIIFVSTETYGVSSVTVGGVNATHLVGTSGTDAFLDAWYIARASSGTEEIVVTLSGSSSVYQGGFIAVSVKNSTTGTVDSAAGGTTTTSSDSEIAVDTGAPGRLILVACGTLAAGGPTITLDSQLALVSNYVEGSYYGLSVGAVIDPIGDAFNFNNQWTPGSYAVSMAVAIKP